MIAFFTAPVVVGGGLLLLGGAYILNNPQAREVVRDLPKHLPSLLNNLNPFRVDPLANGEVRQPERFPKRTPVDGVGGVGGFNDGERMYLPNNTGHLSAQKAVGERLGGFNAGSQMYFPSHTGHGRMSNLHKLSRQCFDINTGDDDMWRELDELNNPAPNVSPEAQAISRGHAYTDHIRQFPGISTQDEFAQIIDDIINSPTEVKKLRNKRTAYWSDKLKTVVITDPGDIDGGTAFKPSNGRDYLDGLK